MTLLGLLPKRELGFSALADVARDLCRADDLSRLRLYRRDAEGNVDRPPVPGCPDGFVVLDCDAASHLIQNIANLAPQPIRHDDIDAFADGFICAESEQVLRRPVPARNDAIERFCNGGIIGGLDGGAEQAFAFPEAVSFVGSLPAHRL